MSEDENVACVSNSILTCGAAVNRHASQTFYNTRGKQGEALQKGALMALDTLAKECQTNLQLYQQNTKHDDALSSTPTPNKTKMKRCAGSPAEVSMPANAAPSSTAEKRKLFKAFAKGRDKKEIVVSAKKLPSSAKRHGDEHVDEEEKDERKVRGSESAEIGKRSRTRTSLDLDKPNQAQQVEEGGEGEEEQKEGGAEAEAEAGNRKRGRARPVPLQEPKHTTPKRGRKGGSIGQEMAAGKKLRVGDQDALSVHGLQHDADVEVGCSWLTPHIRSSKKSKTTAAAAAAPGARAKAAAHDGLRRYSSRPHTAAQDLDQVQEEEEEELALEQEQKHKEMQQKTQQGEGQEEGEVEEGEVEEAKAARKKGRALPRTKPPQEQSASPDALDLPPHATHTHTQQQQDIR